MKTLRYTLALFATLVALTACDSDRDSNPTLSSPTTFVLNTMQYADNAYDLASTESITLLASQPDYGFTAAVSYQAQLSLDNTWTDATDDAAATYYEFADVYTSPSAAIDAATLNTRLLTMNGWTLQSQIPTTGITVYFRMKAYITGRSTETIYSNSIPVLVLPYYVNLTKADPAPWYLIGSCIGDGAWGSTVGASLVPMDIIDGASYDETTGDGTFTFTGYFPAGQGFKIVKTPGAWDYQWGSDGTSFLYNNGGSGNISVSTSGYYTITLNTVSNVLTMEAATVSPTVLSAVNFSGTFNSWSESDAMTAVNTTSDMSGHNHIWRYTLTVDEASQGKFLAGSSAWSGTAFPIGIGTADGANIPIVAGTYTVMFNDISGCYYFVK